MGISGGFVSGHRLSDALSSSESNAPLGSGHRSRPALALIALTILSSTYSLADSGADIYKAKCSACHAADGSGNTMLGKNMKLRPLGSPDVQRQSDNELAVIISGGRSKMPPYDRKLSKDQIDDVVKYIRSLKK